MLYFTPSPTVFGKNTAPKEILFKEMPSISRPYRVLIEAATASWPSEDPSNHLWYLPTVRHSSLPKNLANPLRESVNCETSNHWKKTTIFFTNCSPLSQPYLLFLFLMSTVSNFWSLQQSTRDTLQVPTCHGWKLPKLLNSVFWHLGMPILVYIYILYIIYHISAFYNAKVPNERISIQPQEGCLRQRSEIQLGKPLLTAPII